MFSANLAQMAPHCRCGSGISQRRMSYTGVAAGSVGRWHDLPYRQVLQSLPADFAEAGAAVRALTA